MPLRAALLLSCLVALACHSYVAPVPAGSGGTPARLRVASYNTWLLPIASDDLSERLERLPAALRAEEPDVICLQEVWLGAHATALTRAFAAALPYAARSGGGLLVLSRWPVQAQRFVAYPTQDLPLTERLAGKGLLDVVLRTPHGDVRIVNTHLALDQEPGQPGQMRQRAVLLRHLQVARDLPLILAGDLNFSAGSGTELNAAWRTLTEGAGLHDVWAPTRLPDGGWARRPPTRVGWPRSNLRASGWDPDTLMYRGGGARHLHLADRRIALDEPASALSDHNLLVATWHHLAAPAAAR